MFWIALWAYAQDQGYLEMMVSWSGLELHFFLEYPSWLVKWPTLLVLAVLAIAENILENEPAWIETVGSQDGPIKSLAHMFFSQWVLVKLTVASSALLTIHAGFDYRLIWLVPIALATWVFALFRRRAFQFLVEMDEEDDLGLRKLLLQTEDVGIALSTLFMFILPLFALILGLVAMGFLLLLRMYVIYREQQIKVPCTACKKDIHPCAPNCGHCNFPQEDVVGISLFNLPTDMSVSDPIQHKLRLLLRRRCPNCATRLPKACVSQACPTCGTQTFHSLEQAQQLDEYLYWLFPKTLLNVFLFGLIPVVGLIPGIIYYRLNLISGYRNYLPRLHGCFARYVAKVLSLFLVALQGIPVLGALSLASLCFLQTAIYRSAFRAALRKEWKLPSENVP